MMYCAILGAVILVGIRNTVIFLFVFMKETLLAG